MDQQTPLLRTQNIRKTFPGTIALQDLSLSFSRGEIHGIVGENGAGKTTLMLILCGLLQPDNGQIHLEGEPVVFPTVSAAASKGIALVPQEILHFPNLSVIDNVFAGRYLTNRWGGIDWRRTRAEAARLLGLFDVKVDPTRPLKSYPLATAQMVTILQALSRQLRVLILDEPTSALADDETHQLFDVLRELKAHGVTSVIVSHRLPEVFAIADRISVLRDGALVNTFETASTTPDMVVRAMVGHQLAEEYLHDSSESTNEADQVALEARHLSGEGFDDFSFALRQGEIVSAAGLAGDGRIQLAKTLAGLLHSRSGEVLIRGREVRMRSLGDAIRHGVGFIPEDRKKEGLFPELSVAWNAIAVNRASFGGFRFIRRGKEKEAADSVVRNFSIKVPSIRAKARNLSGGNQQKLLLGKWLGTRPKILIACEATRGVDVGAKAEIHTLLREFAAQGVAILLVSSDLPELLALGHRVLVAHRGRLVADLPNRELSESLVMNYASQGTAS